MDYMQFCADHVDENGNVTQSATDDELGIEFNGRDIQAALLGAYNFGKITPLPLNKGAAPRSYRDYKWHREEHQKKMDAEAAKLRKKGKSIGYGFGSYEHPKSNQDIGYLHWIMLADLLAFDYERLVVDIRSIPNWREKLEKYGLSMTLAEGEYITLENFIGEDFLAKMRGLVEQGYNRITFWNY